MPRIFVVLTLAFAFSLVGCWEGITRSIFATVLSARGEVSVLEKGSTNFRRIESGANLTAGTVLKTSADTELNLELVPGALAQTLGDSELKIEDLKLTKDGNETGDAMRERIARIALRRGGMIVLFEGFARFTIETDQATITVLPSCLFKLDVNDSRTRLTCVRGKLYVNPKSGQMVPVDGGYFREWPSDQGNAPATKDQQAQVDTAATLQAARELQELEAARRDHLPF